MLLGIYKGHDKADMLREKFRSIFLQLETINDMMVTFYKDDFFQFFKSFYQKCSNFSFFSTKIIIF